MTLAKHNHSKVDAILEICLICSRCHCCWGALGGKYRKGSPSLGRALLIFSSPWPFCRRHMFWPNIRQFRGHIFIIFESRLTWLKAQFDKSLFFVQLSDLSNSFSWIAAFWQIFAIVQKYRDNVAAFVRDNVALILQFAYKVTKNVMALHGPNSMCIVKMILPRISFSPS